jgi:hypothetical protein
MRFSFIDAKRAEFPIARLCEVLEVWTAKGWLYLAIVLVGWAVSDRLKKGLALCALRRAIALRQPRAGILHCDCGS